RAQRPRAAVGEETVVAEVIVGVAERDAGDDTVEELVVIPSWGKSQVAHRLSDLGVVAMLPVGRADCRHGTDVSETIAGDRAVEPSQDQYAALTDAREPTLGSADAGP